jgi:hypothetical protein
VCRPTPSFVSYTPARQSVIRNWCIVWHVLTLDTLPLLPRGATYPRTAETVLSWKSAKRTTDTFFASCAKAEMEYSPPAGGTPFIPMRERRGLQSRNLVKIASPVVKIFTRFTPFRNLSHSPQKRKLCSSTGENLDFLCQTLYLFSGILTNF